MKAPSGVLMLFRSVETDIFEARALSVLPFCPRRDTPRKIVSLFLREPRNGGKLNMVQRDHHQPREPAPAKRLRILKSR